MLQEVGLRTRVDQFASEHDAQLVFMLRARQAAWSPGYPPECGPAGFVAGFPGRMVLPRQRQAGLRCWCWVDTQAALSDDPEQSAIRELLAEPDVPR